MVASTRFMLLGYSTSTVLGERSGRETANGVKTLELKLPEIAVLISRTRVDSTPRMHGSDAQTFLFFPLV